MYFTHKYKVFLFYFFIAVVFPQDLLENGFAANNFAMLGLGDIVIPGIFIAMLLRFDIRYEHLKENTYLCNYLIAKFEFVVGG